MEQAHRVRAAADAGDQRVRQAALLGHDLRAHLVADHRLEVAHHGRIGMRPGDAADQVEGVVDIGDPVAQGLVHGVLQGRRARGHRPHLGAEQAHAEHVRLLPLDVARTHVDDALQAAARGDRGGRDAVLAGAGLGDDAPLAHAPGEQDLADAVVDLVRAGVVELVALEVDPGAAEMRGEPLGEIERARPAGVVGEPGVELGPERRIVPGRVVGLLELEDQRHQGLGDEAAAVDAEPAARVGAAAIAVHERHVGLTRKVMRPAGRAWPRPRGNV